MKKNLPTEFVFSLFALRIAVILVHAIYLTIIRPNADEIIEGPHADSCPC